MFRTDAQQEIVDKFYKPDVDAMWLEREIMQDARNRHNQFKNESRHGDEHRCSLPQLPRRGIRLQQETIDGVGHATMLDVHGNGDD